jgi:hypothetical protein
MYVKNKLGEAILVYYNIKLFFNSVPMLRKFFTSFDTFSTVNFIKIYTPTQYIIQIKKIFKKL